VKQNFSVSIKNFDTNKITTFLSNVGVTRGCKRQEMQLKTNSLASHNTTHS